MRLCLVYDIISNNTSDNPLDLIDILKSFINFLEQKKNNYLTFKNKEPIYIYYIYIYNVIDPNYSDAVKR